MAESKRDGLPRDAQPMDHNPNLPHRNPNLMQPGHDPDEIDQRPTPKPSRRTSSLWVWVFVGAIVLLIFGAVFFIGGTGEIAQVPIDDTLPTGEPTTDAQ